MATIGIEDDIQITVWDLLKGQKRAILPRTQKGRGVMAFDKDNAILACAEDTGVIQLWNVRSRQIVAEIVDVKNRLENIIVFARCSFRPMGNYW